MIDLVLKPDPDTSLWGHREDYEVGIRPYKGLAPFEEKDAPFFFGRQAERAIVIANLVASRLTLLYGSSGVGKTSLLQAGVLPELHNLSRHNLETRTSPELATVLFSSWKEAPHVGLRTAVVGALERLLSNDGPILPPSSDLCKVLQIANDRIGGDLLIILDQFEEYFLYNERDAEKKLFEDEFARAVNDPALRVNFLISIREESLARLDRFKGRIPDLFDNYLRVQPLKRETALGVIEKPVQEYNRRKLPGSPIHIERKLVDEVLDQVVGEGYPLSENGRGIALGQRRSQTEGIDASHLQLVLNRLWEEERKQGSERLRSSTLKGLGGPRQIMRDHLDSSMKDLDRKEQEIASLAFHHLVTPSGTKIAHSISDLANYVGADKQALTRVVEKLSSPQVRILRIVESDSKVRTKIFHDALAVGVLDWQKRFGIRQRSIGRLYKRLAVVGALVILLLVSASLVSYANQQYELRLSAFSRSLAAQSLFQLRTKPDLALLLSVEAYRSAPTLDAQRSLLEALQSNPPVEKTILDIANRPFSAVAVHENLLAYARAHGTVTLLDTKRQQSLAVLQPPFQSVNSVAFNPRGSLLALAGGNGTVRLWDVATANILHDFTAPEGFPVHEVEFSSDGSLLAAAGDDGVVRVWDTNTRKENRLLASERNQAVYCLSFGPDRIVAFGGADGQVNVWDLAADRLLRRLPTKNRNSVYTVAISDDGKYLAGACSSGMVYLWNLEDIIEGKKKVLASELPIGERIPVYSLAFSHDSSILASGDSSGAIRLWNPAWEEALQVLSAHRGAIRSLAFSPDRKLFSASDAGSIRIWNELPLSGHRDSVQSVAFSPDGSLLASASSDGSIHFWDVAERRLRGEPLNGHMRDIYSIAFHPDGSLLASGGYENVVRLWDVDKREALNTLRGHDSSVLSLAFSPDGSLLATASADQTIRMWDPASQVPVGQPLTGHQGRVWSVAFSPDSSLLASGGNDQTIRLWDVPSRTLIRELVGHEDAVRVLAFDHRGVVLASYGRDSAIRLWDVTTGRALGGPLIEDRKPGICLVFTPDGTLISGSEDKTLHLWDVQQKESIGVLFSGLKSVDSLAVRSDGLVAFANGDPFVRFVKSDPQDWLKQGCRIAGRNLDQEEWKKYVGSEIPYRETCSDLESPRSLN